MKLSEPKIIAIILGIVVTALVVTRFGERGDCCQGGKVVPPREDTHPRPASDTNTSEVYWRKLGYD